MAKPIATKFFETNGKNMAFIKFNSIRDAVRILVIFHNYNINGM